MERRELFKILGAGAAISEGVTGQHQHAPAAKRDRPYTAQVFTADQQAMLTRLADIIFPRDERSPGAGEAGVWQYLDLYAAFSGKTFQEHFSNGLKLVNDMARKQSGAAFMDLSGVDQDRVVGAMAARENDTQDPAGRFFVELKRHVILGYHYSEAGMRDYMGYRGNTAIPEFRGCTHPEHKRG